MINLAKIETEDVVVNPVLTWVCGIRKQHKGLSKLHGIGSIINQKIAVDKYNDSIRILRQWPAGNRM